MSFSPTGIFPIWRLVFKSGIFYTSSFEYALHDINNLIRNLFSKIKTNMKSNICNVWKIHKFLINVKLATQSEFSNINDVKRITAFLLGRFNYYYFMKIIKQLSRTNHLFLNSFSFVDFYQREVFPNSSVYEIDQTNLNFKKTSKSN